MTGCLSAISLLFRASLDRRRAVRVEAWDCLQPPSLALFPFGFGPGHRLPVRLQDQPRARIRHLDAVAGRLIDIKEEGALDGVLVRTGFDEDAILEKDVGSPQHIIALIDRIGDVVEAAMRA